MEMTPSLACANKCVFCWRHHTNPVGTSWKWKTDEAKDILDGVLKEHRYALKSMRGVPGVVPKTFEEGQNPAHVALSLVGEPIMYPKINELITLMHEKQMSTFVVNNAQFPDELKKLQPVT